MATMRSHLLMKRDRESRLDRAVQLMGVCEPVGIAICRHDESLGRERSGRVVLAIAEHRGVSSGKIVAAEPRRG